MESLSFVLDLAVGSSAGKSSQVAAEPTDFDVACLTARVGLTLDDADDPILSGSPPINKQVGSINSISQKTNLQFWIYYKNIILKLHICAH